jgi:hypothetical protein
MAGALSLDQSDLGSDLDERKQFLDMLIVQADAPGRALAPDFSRIVGAVYKIGWPAQIHCTGAQRVAWFTTFHTHWQQRITLAH